MFVQPTCKFCGYAPCSVDAAICPRCGQACPNPGLGTRFNAVTSAAIGAVSLLILFGIAAGYAMQLSQPAAMAILATWLVIAIGMVVKALWYAVDPTLSIFPIKHS
jgi:hypothetical protein